MNQDFALLATPANARRLILLQQVSKIELSSDIIALAATDCLGETAFDPLVCPMHPVKLAVSQFLLDCGLRGIIQTAYHPEIDPITVLNMMRIDKVIVLSHRQRTWRRAATVLGMTIQCISSIGWLEHNLSQVDRHAVLIYDADANNFPSRLRHLVREFPRFIIYDATKLSDVTHWIVWARILCPHMPSPVYLMKDTSDLPLAAFAVFYNVGIFRHLIMAPSIVAALDDLLVERVVQSRLLTF